MCLRNELIPPHSFTGIRMSRLKEKIDTGDFIVTAELGPPRSASPRSIIKKVTYFQDGVDAVNITDNQTAIVRLSSIAAAAIVREHGLEPVIQMTCRDRNRIAIQGDLLGAAALGIENVLCLTGDHVTFGDHPEARPVFDLDSVQLLKTVAYMNSGRFLSGEKIKTRPTFCCGGAANPFAPPLRARLRRLRKKIEAGARFIQTQAIFDPTGFEEWMTRVRKAGLDKECAILAGVMPVKSAKPLIYMKEEVPGMVIPDSVIERLDQAGDPKVEGIALAAETIKQVSNIEGVQGIHLMPLMWEKVTPKVLKKAGLI